MFIICLFLIQTCLYICPIQKDKQDNEQNYTKKKDLQYGNPHRFRKKVWLLNRFY